MLLVWVPVQLNFRETWRSESGGEKESKCTVCHISSFRYYKSFMCCYSKQRWAQLCQTPVCVPPWITLPVNANPVQQPQLRLTLGTRTFVGQLSFLP